MIVSMTSADSTFYTAEAARFTAEEELHETITWIEKFRVDVSVNQLRHPAENKKTIRRGGL
jgi:hypothetical protein